MKSPVTPIVVLGMHRSGTSLLARLLEPLGVFLGKEKTVDHEARFFRRLNDWILLQLGVAWDDPRELNRIAADERLRPLIEEHLDHYVRSPQVATFLGGWGWLRSRSLPDHPGAWGWKDPRTCLTLEWWARIFPGMKVVRVVRHGVDVAASLRHRQRQMVASGAGSVTARKLAYAWRPRRSLLLHSVRCLELEWGFQLWERYLDEAQLRLDRLEVPCLDLRYEDLLEDPASRMRDVVAFCGLPVDERAIGEVTARVDAGRRFAFRDDPELTEFAATVEERLAARGYGI